MKLVCYTKFYVSCQCLTLFVTGRKRPQPTISPGEISSWCSLVHPFPTLTSAQATQNAHSFPSMGLHPIYSKESFSLKLSHSS